LSLPALKPKEKGFIEHLKTVNNEISQSEMLNLIGEEKFTEYNIF
jgi:hypothetical protein